MKDIIWKGQKSYIPVDRPKLSSDMIDSIISKKVIIWRNSFLVFTICVMLMTFLFVFSGFLISNFFDANYGGNTGDVGNSSYSSYSSSSANDSGSNSVGNGRSNSMYSLESRSKGRSSMQSVKEYVIKFGSFSNKNIAKKFQSKLIKIYNGEVFVVQEGNIFHVISDKFQDYETANSIISSFNKKDSIYGTIQSV